MKKMVFGLILLLLWPLWALADVPNMMTEAIFSADDLPEGILEPCDAPGRVERLRYVTTDENQNVKSVTVYLPNGYDETDRRYNVLYILHASGGKVTNYLNPDSATDFQNLLDHMIANGRLEPLIVVAPTYYQPDSFLSYMPLATQVQEAAAVFPRELAEDIVPAVESTYRTFAESTDADGLQRSRLHRGVAGFSLGGTAAWYVFLQRMDAFSQFMPISEASWDDGEGGISGIWHSDLSAQTLYDAVLNQGYYRDDFRLFVATGTEDEAFQVATEQMISLLDFSDMFIPGKNTSCSMMIGGTHTLAAIYTYMYHILPALFADSSAT